MKLIFEFEAGEGRDRLDDFLAGRLLEFSRTRLRRAIAEGDALVNGSPAPKGLRLNPGDRVRLSMAPGERSCMTPEAIPLEVLYESDELIVINKPAGLLVHPSHAQKTGTLCNALAHHFLCHGGVAIRPGLLHRLDRDTSGVLAVAKTARAHRLLGKAFEQRRVKKEYLALVEGRVASDSGLIEAPIGRNAEHWPRWGVADDGLPAQTRYTVRQRFDRHTLMELEPLTGRTHQLRIHCLAIGHPIVGDRVYGSGRARREAGSAEPFQLLHAFRLSLRHPATGQEMTFTAPLPAWGQA